MMDRRLRYRRIVRAALAVVVTTAVAALWPVRTSAFRICHTINQPWLLLFCADGHYEITNEGLNLIQSDLRPSQAAIEAVANADEQVDVGENSINLSPPPFLIPNQVSYDYRHHFDRTLNKSSAEAFLDGLTYLNARRAAVIGLLSGPDVCKSIPEVLSNLGFALHAVQDAYAHSNYVDPVSTDKSAFDSAIRYPNLFLESPNPPASLLLTLYDKNAPSGDFDNPDGTCTNNEPPSADNYCHKYHSKDVKGIPTNPFDPLYFGPPGYADAYSAAVASTTEFVRGIATDPTLADGWQAIVTYKTTADVCQALVLTPNSGAQGDTGLALALTGQSTHFVDGTTVADFGAGVSLSSLAVSSPTDATGVISIDAAAATGPRLVALTTDSETVTGLFTIVPPILTDVSPDRGQQGRANLVVRLTGRSTHFSNNTTADFGPGIAVNSIVAEDATHATANLTIDLSAALGPRTVLVTTGEESVSRANAFAVLASCQQVPPGLGVSVNTIVFDSDGSGRSQVCTQELDASQTALNSSTQITNGGAGQQQSQEPQWSLSASAGTDAIGRIAYQFGAPGVRGIHIVKPDGTGDVKVTPFFNSIIRGGPENDAHYPCADARDPAWSPDGQSIAYACLVTTQTTSNYDIWIHATGGTPDDPTDDFDYPLLTLTDSLELKPAWSPDGTKIAFVTNAKGFSASSPNSKIAVTQALPAATPIGPGGGVSYVQSVGTFSILTDDGFTNFSPTWSPDSRAIAFSSTRSGGRDICRMSSTYGTSDLGTLVRLTSNPGSDANPAWSPDGRLIAFASDRSGKNQLYVMSALQGEADNANFKQITNTSGNSNNPAWKPHETAIQNSLTVVTHDIIVGSGVAAPTGSGTVTVSDGFGTAVSGAFVTMLPPSTGSGTLAFAPSSGLTDQAGNFSFVVAEPTLQAAGDHSFTVNAFDSTTARSGSTTATIRVGGSAPQVPGPIPVPPQERLPVGQPVFRQQTKMHFVQQAQAASIEALRDIALHETGFSALLGPIGRAWSRYTIQSVATNHERAARFLVLANDPPDPNVSELATPVVRPPILIMGSGGPMSVNTLTLMNQSLSQKAITNAYLDALVTSINRYSTAVAAGDLGSAALQRNAILAYEDTLTLLLRAEADTANRLLTSMQADGLPNPQVHLSDITALQAAIGASGLPSEISELLLQLGLTSSDIATIRDSFVEATPASLVTDLFATVQADAERALATSVAFAQASPTAPLLVPTIAVAGGTFVYDGRSHGATVTSTGVSGAPVRGLFSITYTPGGSTPPLNIGTYTVTAEFTSTDPNYTNATGTGRITISDPRPLHTVVPAGDLQFARVSHQATPLANGLVLMSGGQRDGAALPQAELFNPNTSSWSVTGSSIIPRFDHTATLLADGRVLVVGGVSATGECCSNATSEMYDPAKGTWSLTGRLPFPVGTGHIAIRLLDGRLLVSGGGDRCGSVFSTAALFNPSTNTWSPTGSMTTAREFHSAALLQDGRVLVSGGVRGFGLPSETSAEIYDPDAGTWTSVADMGTPRQTSCNGYVQPYLATLSGGSVLAAGGFSGADCSSITPSRTVTDVIVTPSAVDFAALGRTQSLTVNSELSDGSSGLFTGPLQFATANSAVASVDAFGVITARGAGTTTITVTPSGFAPVAVTTTVDAAHLTSISVSPPAISFIGSGQTHSLAINGTFSDGSQRSVTTGLTFESSNTAVAGVDQAGLVTPGANGSATITVSATGAPAVQVPIFVKSLVALAPSPTSLTLIGPGQTQALSIVGQYSDGSQQTLTTGLSFISSNPSGARVDLSGFVTSGTNGEATITIAAANVPAIQVPVTVKSLVSIALSPAAVTLTGAGATQTLSVIGTYSDTSTSPIATGVTFSSSDANVATVSATGMVTSVGPGVATITASMGSLAPAQATVTVNPVANVCVTAPAGLVSWWPGNGDALDLLGQNNPSALNAVSFVPGKVGQGFAFGADGYIDIPASPSLANQRFSLEAWVKPDGVGPNNDEFGSVIIGQIIDGAFAVTATFKSADANYANAAASDSITIAPAVSDIESWTTRTPMPTARGWLTAGEVNHRLYAIGGFNSTYLTTVEAYDPSTNTWQSQAAMPTARSHVASGVVNGVIYVVGGYNGGSLATLEAYDPTTNTWTTKTSMPTPRYAPAAGVINGVLYVVGGYLTSTLEAYDPATDTWATKAPMPTARGHLAVGVVNGLLYAVGGIAGSALATVEAYDPVTNTWTTKAPMPTPRWHLGVGVAKGTLYALAGASCNGDCPLSTAEAYDPLNDTWRAIAPMPMARGWLAAGVASDTVYAIGGSTCNFFGGNCALSTNEALQVNHASVQVNWRATDNRFIFLFGDVLSERIISEHSFPPGQFYLVTATYDGTEFRLFVNGVLEGTLTLTKTISYATTPWSIGSNGLFRDAGFPRTWNGVIDEVSLYNRALSQSEIQAIFAASGSGKCPPTPIISSVSPKYAFPGTTVANFTVIGSNLTGSAFSFLPAGSLTPGVPVIHPAGTEATFEVIVPGGVLGTFTVVATNTVGTSDPAPSAANTLSIIHPDADHDGDGYINGLEDALGSDPLDPASVPNLRASGEVVSAAFAIRNDVLPTTGQALQAEVVSATFAILNSAPVTTGPISQEVDSPTFSILNSTFNVTANLEVVSAAFSVLNNPGFAATTSSEDVAGQAQIGSTRDPAAATLQIDGLPSGGVLVAGETVLLSVESPDDRTFTSAELIVNGEPLAEDGTHPFEFTFTVPDSAEQLTFEVLVAREGGDLHESEELRYTVQRDSRTTVVGEVSRVGPSSEAEIRVGILANGLLAEFVDFQTPLTDLSDLRGGSSRLRRAVSSINSRNPNQVFGPDPFAVQMGPDYAVRFSGWLRVHNPGRYRFFLGADDGARLVMDGRTILELPLGTGTFQEASEFVDLSAGLLPIEATYFQTVGTGEVQLSFEPPGKERQVIRPSQFLTDLGLTASPDDRGGFRIENAPTIVEGLAVTVRAQDAQGNETTGISNAVRAVRGGITDVGAIRIRMRR